MTRAIAGQIYAGGQPLAYEAAVARYDYFAAQAPRVEATDRDLARDLARECIALHAAIREAAAWRRCAGWSNPADADRGRHIARGCGDD